MEQINYEEQVKKVYPDAVCHEEEDCDYDDYGKCYGFVVHQINFGSEWFGWTTKGEKAAWQSAYEKLKQQDKII